MSCRPAGSGHPSSRLFRHGRNAGIDNLARRDHAALKDDGDALRPMLADGVQRLAVGLRVQPCPHQKTTVRALVHKFVCMLISLVY